MLTKYLKPLVNVFREKRGNRDYLNGKSLAKTGDTVVLAGVYIENTVRSWLKIVGSTGKLIVIEANPQNVENVRPKFRDDQNIYFVPKAVWDKKCELTFTASGSEYQAWARVKDNSVRDYPIALDDSAHDIEIEGDTIDNILQSIGITSVDLIYMTVNDAQLKAVDGIAAIRNSSHNFQLYIHSRTPYPSEETAQKLRDIGMNVVVGPIDRSKCIRPDVKKVYIYAHD